MASHKRAKEHGARRQDTGLGAVDKARISHPGQWVSSYFLTLPVWFWFWFWCWCRCCWFSGCGSHLNLPTGDDDCDYDCDYDDCQTPFKIQVGVF
uniref:HDC10033 n=1 Tax=Drosophila melanogaster TaxID=7227 RepID=Q6IL90_DROME|nr:TPA_inf: HDC10033 [Drosophila melanogaster]